MDYDRFSPGHAPEAGFLTVLEEVPGLIHFEDMTAQLIVSGILVLDILDYMLRSLLFVHSYLKYSNTCMTNIFVHLRLSCQNDSYWASYNNPFFADIAELSGNSARCRAAPLTACHDTDPRARIFQQRQGRVAGLRDFQALMSYNDFRNDPLSLNDSCNVCTVFWNRS